ncbi:uncharacterized protein LOC141620918 [Silene latifolia]|uniref:uncharacterized protein LOC141620918 n=1 Tax=Silene latifolia TaxID=37657 RepID=UPI003D78B06F
MFREPSEAEREADLAGASGDDLLLPEEDYSAFLYGRLAYWPVVEVEAAGIEPPEYPETLEYTDATGRTTISELRDFDVAVTDAGLDDWQHLIRRVAPSRFVALWRVANRLRATAIEALVGGRGRQDTYMMQEWSYIPVGGSLPSTEQRNLAFGALQAWCIQPQAGYKLA